jgi:hypothetical protein
MKDIFGISALELCRALSERIALEGVPNPGATPQASVVWALPAPKLDATDSETAFPKDPAPGLGFLGAKGQQTDPKPPCLLAIQGWPR